MHTPKFRTPQLCVSFEALQLDQFYRFWEAIKFDYYSRVARMYEQFVCTIHVSYNVVVFWFLVDLQIVPLPYFLHFEHFLYELALLAQPKYLLKKSILLVSLVYVSTFDLSYVKPDFY